MVLDGALAAAIDDHHLLRSGAERLFHDELDGRGIDDGQHLLGHRLGGRQEARAQAGGGDDDLAQRLVHGHLAGRER